MTWLETAAALHREHPMVVGHIDLPAELQLCRQFGQYGTLSRYVPRCRAAGIRVLIGAVFVHPAYLPEAALSMAMEQIAALLAEIAESDGVFRLVTQADQLREALASRQIAILLSLEGTQPLVGKPQLLRAFYGLGVRLLGLTWNGRTAAGDGCSLPGRGLTPMGREVVALADALGMILDVSHLNDQGFDDLLAQARGPVIASHSNCRCLCDHPRNLTDGQLVQLARRGGVIGINQIRFLVQQADGGDPLEALCHHILHLSQLTGPGHAGLGLDLARDYMEALPKPRRFWDTWNPSEEDTFSDYSDAVRLSARLLERGMSETEVIALLGGNFLRLLENKLH